MNEKLLTRRQAVALIRERLGVPVPLSRMEKECCWGTGPEPTARYGRQNLYSEAAVLAFGASLLKPVNHQTISDNALRHSSTGEPK